jgi:hypothetical protein
VEVETLLNPAFFFHWLSTDAVLHLRSTLACLLVSGLVVELAILPASKQNANPFEGQGSNGCVVGFVLRTLLLIIVPGPD